MMLILLFCALVSTALRFPDTPGGKLVKHLLIDPPARLAAHVTFGRIVILLFVALIIAALFALAKSDGLMMAGQAAPEGLAWLATFDLASWADTVALVMLIGAAARLRGAWVLAANAVRHLCEGAVRQVAKVLKGLRAAANTCSRRRRRPDSDTPKADGDGWPAFGPTWLAA